MNKRVFQEVASGNEVPLAARRCLVRHRRFLLCPPGGRSILHALQLEKEIFMFIAYIDPGSGSILLQVILASCIGGIAVFWSRIKALFTGKKPSEKTPGDEPSKSE